MITSTPKIFVDENEYDFETRNQCSGDHVKLDSETSVSRLKTHFFQTLAEIGEVVRYRREDAVPNTALAKSLMAPGTLVAAFHEPPPDLACRLLQHTKGGLMLPGGFLGNWTLRESTMNLVETQRQKKQLQQSTGNLDLALAVYAQRLATEVFDCQENIHNKRKSEFSLIYAGRFIPNKGIAQLIRALNLWPMRSCKLKLVGDCEPHFLISQAGSQCPNFKRWLQKELFSRNKAVSVSIVAPVSQKKLAKLYRGADAFLYPSFHEDEASGNAAHEAVLAGIPAIVTDWCGLGQLGRMTRGGALPTYPTLGGVRFSLQSLRRQIERVCINEKTISLESVRQDIEWVRNTFDPKKMSNSLRSATVDLLRQLPGPPLPGGWRNKERIQMIMERGPEVFVKALRASAEAMPDGLYPDGLGYENEYYSEASFLTAIQSLYTTWPTAPVLRPGVQLHGFWRVGLWEDERALVEFGFPGPRLLRFSISEWDVVTAAAKSLAPGDFAFEIRDSRAVEVFQLAIDLGYLVPDDPMECNLPAPNDTLPSQGHHL